MASVLTEASTVLCGPPVPPLPAPPTQHGGTVAAVTAAKLAVGGKRVLVSTSLGAIAGCANSAPGTVPCTAVLPAPPLPMATKLRAAGVPVLLDTITGAGKTNGNPPGFLAAAANQVKLTAI